MNMPPRPSQMHAMANPDAARLRQPPGTPDLHQNMMQGQQMASNVRTRAEDRVPQGISAQADDGRGVMMNYDTQQAHADALALNVKANVLKGMGMHGVPLEGMRGVDNAARALGMIV